MTRLFWKLFFALWLSIMAFVAVTAVVNVHLIQRNIPDSPGQVFRRGLERAEQMIGRTLREEGAQAVRERMENLPRHLRDQLFLFDTEGRELLDRDRIRRHIERQNPPLTRRELRDGSGAAWELLVLRKPPPGRLLEPGFRGILHRLLMAALFAAIFSFFLARSLARPLESLGVASRRLAKGELDTRVGEPLTTRGDEFGDLARDFDHMAGRLQQMQVANQRLLRDVSHELRSPLARLRVALELARGRRDGAVAAELDRIELESDRLETLVGQVLDLLRESSGGLPLRTERFDLREMLQDLAEVVSYEAPDGGSGVTLDLPEPLPIEADRELLWRAVENLLRNALVHAGGVRLASRWEEGGSNIVVRVSDDGPGVPAAQLERIFDPFFRVDEARDRGSGGHGLGLAIAAAAVRRHGGTIRARNRVPHGLEITLDLPRGNSARTEAPAA